MRVTDSMLSRMALADVTRARLRLAETQEQAASGLRINRPSDDPVGTGIVVVLEAELAALRQQERTVSATRARVAASESALDNAMDVLLRARELAIQGANGTQDASSRMQIARELEALHASLVAEANTRFAGGHVFAGFASDTAPFSVAGAFSSPPPIAPTVAFVGDSNEIRVEIESGVTVNTGVDGRRVFLGDADGNGAPDAGREDVFGVIADLWQALASDDPAATAAALPRIDRAMDQLSLERTGLGVVASRLDAAERRLGARAVDTQTRLSQVRDADMAEVISNLLQQEAALEAGLTAMGRIIQPSLLDFLS